MESKGKVPHLHTAICRFDENGNINNDHNIHLRAQRAAERVAVKRGWKTAEEIRSRNIPEVSRECMEVLRTMPSWSWEEYKKALAGETILYMNGKTRKMFSEDMRSSKETPNTRLPNWEWPVI